MLFNSYLYIFLFLPLVFFAYFGLNRIRLTLAGKCFLVLASLVYYSWWNVHYVALILLSMLINFAMGSSLGRVFRPPGAGVREPQPMATGNRRTLLWLGVAFNLALLGYYKYTDFFIANLNQFFGLQLPLAHIVLPLAISFFTFQQISFLVDSYKGIVREYDLLNYMLFVVFFPQLIAGPIVHHKEMMPQFKSKATHVLRYPNVAAGLFVFSMGLFKKVVLADTFSIWVSNGFDRAVELSFFEAWLATFSYAFQLYFDFSGYTDMAVGSALLFNIRLPLNFNSPYKACNIQDFWHRWHITLSRFLKDYIYIPLGGNRQGVLKTYRNLFATFLLGGLWHGAGWTFVIWGALHGAATMVQKGWSQRGWRMSRPLAWPLTFIFVCLTWVFFRATSLAGALKMLSGMLGRNGVVLPYNLESHLSFLSHVGVEFGRWTGVTGATRSYELVLFTILGFLVISLKNSHEWLGEFKPSLGRLIVTLLLFITGCLHLLTVKSEFLYFNF